MNSRTSDESLNREQRAVVNHGEGPLLVIAGAGSGKTHTLAHRVARLIRDGADPLRILLLTFTRRAAAELTRRANNIAGRERNGNAHLPWAGTFHGVANRLLRLHARTVGLDPAFTLLDREDAADLLDRLRHQSDLSRTERRFPRKGTCLSIYSRAMNTRAPLREILERSFPWCLEWEPHLRALFGRYTDAKLGRQVLDYDDLLLYWFHLLEDPDVARQVSQRFDHVLVDEYQDTNTIQADILKRLCPTGRGVTVVGDDAQSIYSFRAATVRNILDFPGQFEPAATVLTLTQNYRSTTGILDASNAVMGLASERFTKDLFTERRGGSKPQLVTVADEDAQVAWVAEQILAQRESGILLKQQAVLFRSSHHSDALELELGRRNIPFVKFGGLRFLEAAHIKDITACLRWAENRRDTSAAFRVVQLLPGVGPKHAEHVCRAMLETDDGPATAIGALMPPPSARDDWAGLLTLFARLTSADTPWVGQLGLIRQWYEPYLETLYDNARTRMGDVDQLERLADAAPSREQFLSELTLDPPDVTGAPAGPPHRDEDYLILSTIHSAKGQEWDTVFVLNVVDGCMPSDLATGSSAEIEEERRLLYVAMTRAKNRLDLIHPVRFFIRQQHRRGDRTVVTPRSRFLPEVILNRFERVSPRDRGALAPGTPTSVVRIDVAARLRSLWDAPAPAALAVAAALRLPGAPADPIPDPERSLHCDVN